MYKSHVLFSIALGGLVLAGCNKDENPTPQTVPASMPSSMPTTDATTMPATMPTTTTAPAAAAPAIEDGKALAANVEKKGADAVAGLTKSIPTTIPSIDSK
jgi:hypothetical protein